jgi:hypothetical protein
MRYILLIVGICLTISLKAQNNRYTIEGRYLTLTEEGQRFYKNTLPESVDNSTSIYFPLIYDQTHWVCNQVASSYYSFSYEYNRVNSISSQNINNCFSVYFPWNWANSGYGWWGNHYCYTFNILKNVGIPIITESEADNHRDSSKWMSGYENYYNAMQYRIEDYYLINCKTEEGLNTLKAWVYDHGNGETPGGVGVFLSNIASNGSGYLPSESAYPGQYVIHTCGNSSSHSNTIVGYNDNICWDYNEDGQYTNDIDINEDGIVDIRDWERGGFKYAESFGTDWGDNGFAYIMYKCFADSYEEGGFLNNDVGVIKPLKTYNPMLTAKVKLKYEDRDNLKISFGVSSDPQSNEPDHEIDFPIMNYSEGNNFYMQGGTSEADKTIELGFDISKLLDYIKPGEQAAFFLIIREYDIHNDYYLDLHNYSIYSYTTCPEFEHVYSGNMETVNNGITYKKLNLSVNFNKPVILTENLPLFNSNQNFTYYLQSENGEAPIEWSMHPHINQSHSNYEFNELSENKITPDEYFDDCIALSLPFDFPFNNKTIRNIKVHSDGYIMLDSTRDVYNKYFRDYAFDFFANEEMIAPHMRYKFVCDPAYGDGIWFEANEDKASIRWKCSQKYSEAWSDARFGVDLFPDGTFRFLYGNSTILNNATSLSGVSLGDNINYLVCNTDEMSNANTKIDITIYPLPQSLSLSKTGILTGNIEFNEPYPVKFKITDNNFRTDIKTFNLITGIDNVSFNNLKIYPNPASTILTIESDNILFDNYNMEIINTEGKIIQKNIVPSGYNKVQIDVSEFKAGHYILKIYNGNKTFTNNFTILE